MLVTSARTIRTEVWCGICVMVVMLLEAAALNGDHVCMVQQKYNITKRVKYRAPMSVRTYEWCFAMPPRCSKWSTEMRDLTRLETEERTAEVAVCCPGYKMRDVACVPVCPSGKTGNGCSEDCPKGKWGPNCVYECKKCSEHGSCSPVTGRCRCQDGWQGERCEMSMSTPSLLEELTITKPVTMATSGTGNESTTLSSTRTTLSSTDKVITTTARIAAGSTIVPFTTMSPTAATTVLMTPTTASPLTVTRAPTTPKVTTTSTLAPTTYMTSATASTIETTLPTIKVATMGVNKQNAMTQTFTTANTYSKLNNVTLTTPWIVLTHKSMVTRHPTVTITTSKIATVANTESVKLPTTLPSTPTISKMPTMSPPLLRTDTSRHINILTTTTKAAKENLITYSSVKEATKKPEMTAKSYPTTIQLKPKEIWIKPAQKGELLIDTKVKPDSDLPKYKSATKKDVTMVTTPRTIIVSIIPTSISYATFKKIALTTSSYFPHKNATGKATTETSTSSMSPSTSSPIAKSTSNSVNSSVTNLKSRSHFTAEPKSNNATNSMRTNIKPNSSLTTISSTNAPRKLWTTETPTKSILTSTSKPATTPKGQVTDINNKQLVIPNRNHSITKAAKVTEKPAKDIIGKTNDTNKITTVRPNANVTEEPEGEETFHILTEPEHITAVMGEKGTERSSVDLISVISIAGGVMMTVITVAVVIVMLERCKRPRYEAKMNNIRMQVMIDNNDGPPPYVRSIFNTPLPEPPNTEKCHYQPISTLDRNLKQFMRPVVVQTISPMMLENFRGILECHYDHLPRRSIEFQTLPARHSLAPSLSGHDEPRQQRPDSLAESTIEALKCEAKLDVIDSTTSEPLYAEIPCWRPPSEHAIEIVNLNGEAVTEL